VAFRAHGLPRFETWVCDECRLTFLLDFAPATRCATHGEDAHCHVGHRIVCHDGKVIYAAASSECQPYAVNEYL
jgi:hypothetical protein